MCSIKIHNQGLYNSWRECLSKHEYETMYSITVHNQSFYKADKKADDITKVHKSLYDNVFKKNTCISIRAVN